MTNVDEDVEAQVLLAAGSYRGRRKDKNQMAS